MQCFRRNKMYLVDEFNSNCTGRTRAGFGFVKISALTFLIALLSHLGTPLFGQKSNDSLRYEVKRKWLLAGEAACAVGSIVALDRLWYADYPRGGFRFINDNSEWLQMDKAGHLFSAYTIGSVQYDAMRWAGYSEKASLWWGGSSGLIYLTAIELLDGNSRQWGFSATDETMNALGASLFIAQQHFWKQQRITLKFSYSESDYAMLNNAQLGRNFQQRILKDYNAQTYWLSTNISCFLASDAAFPKWLNVAFGYGATKMITAKNTTFDVNNFQREREFYLSFDADLNRIRWPKKWMRTTARILSIIKIPAPTIRVQSDGSVKMFALFF